MQCSGCAVVWAQCTQTWTVSDIKIFCSDIFQHVSVVVLSRCDCSAGVVSVRLSGVSQAEWCQSVRLSGVCQSG